MAAVLVEQKTVRREGARRNAYAALHAPRYGCAALVDSRQQCVPVPFDAARAQGVAARRALELARRTLRHAPAFALPRAVEDRVERAVLLGVGRFVAARSRVVGREDAADEDDQGHRLVPVITDGIRVPPQITVRGDRCGERDPRRSRFVARQESARLRVLPPGNGIAQCRNHRLVILVLAIRASSACPLVISKCLT